MTAAPDAGDADLAAFIGPNADYYLTERRVMAAAGSRVSWNWPACLFTFAWLAYRRMWGKAALVAALTLLLNLSLIFAWATPVMMLVLGLYGNAFYLDHARAKLAAVGPSGDAAARTGGVSWAAAALTVALSAIAGIVVAVVWGGALAALFGGWVWWHLSDLFAPR